MRQLYVGCYRLRRVAAIAGAICFLAYWHEPTDTQSQARLDRITGRAWIIDGDSLEINGRKIRLWGIDAVELQQTCTVNNRPWACGKIAQKVLRNVIADAPLTCIARDIDRYGRTVAECFLGSGSSINATMVERGWALAYRRYTEQYLPHEDRARMRKLGIWQSSFVAPWEWRKR
ncbi:thermonuclease family protein [Oscillatoria sp. CS-180]|uniref:thermonuclease family protein n=1 Tax=Oscillatoria sp. CS-180 TaxID=3021720 RepID=UPI00232F49CB|nr:thermonuclease family protein [Oscillatoria sp. CS-180]MDB9529073.1 thermonuclease family protein [Oscillatoria sp. CS-180]